MFNVGGPEFLIILLVALVVLGPTRLPDALRQVGKFIGEAKKLSTNFQNEVQEAMNDPVKAATGVELPKTKQDVANAFGVVAPFSSQEAKPKTAPDDGVSAEPSPNVEASIEPVDLALPAEPAEPAVEATNERSGDGVGDDEQGTEGTQDAERTSKIEPSAIPPAANGYDPIGEISEVRRGDWLDTSQTAKPVVSDDSDIPMFGDR